MTEPLVGLLRLGLPLAALVAGLAVALAGGTSGSSIETGAVIAGVGVAFGLLGALQRTGASPGEPVRREEAALRYFDEHGHWPDQLEQAEPRAGRR